MCENRPLFDETVELADNAMLRVRPELFDEWDFEKNDALGLDIYKLTKGMDQKIWWLCPMCESNYVTRIINRAIRRQGCPYCSGRKVNHTNSFAAMYPDLLKEWDYIKNKEVSPEFTSCGSSKKVWWTCEDCKSSYDMRVSHKVNGIGCPFCSGYRANHTNSLKTLNPTLAVEWHSTKNGKLTANDVPLYSNKKVWWIGNCGHEWISSITNRTRGNGCPICGGKRILIGFNDMWTTNPELAKLLLDSEDGYRFIQMSNKKVNWKCRTCNEIVLNKTISEVSMKGLSCSSCSDGVSYPEKFLYNTLKQLGITPKPQMMFSWSKNKRYDFYIPQHNMIIEVHGEQHYEDRVADFFGGRSLEDEKVNDDLKQKLANENDILNNYIVINASTSTKEYMKKSLSNSKLVDFFSFEGIDWDVVHKDSIKSTIKTAYSMWNKETYSIEDISREVGVSVATIKRYLREGTKSNLCKFPRISKAQAVRDSVRRRVVQLDSKNTFIKEWDAVVDASRGIGISASTISACLNGRQKTSGGYRWIYIEDYYKEAN